MDFTDIVSRRFGAAHTSSSLPIVAVGSGDTGVTLSFANKRLYHALKRSKTAKDDAIVNVKTDRIGKLAFMAENICLQIDCFNRLNAKQKKFCSIVCAGKAKRGRMRGNHSFASAKKYIQISAGGDKVYLHRHLMELRIGRRLDSQEIVHHLDEDPSNNDIQNLMLFGSQAEHLEYHRNNPVLRQDLTEELEHYGW